MKLLLSLLLFCLLLILLSVHRIGWDWIMSLLVQHRTIVGSNIESLLRYSHCVVLHFVNRGAEKPCFVEADANVRRLLGRLKNGLSLAYHFAVGRLHRVYRLPHFCRSMGVLDEICWILHCMLNVEFMAWIQNVLVGMKRLYMDEVFVNLRCLVTSNTVLSRRPSRHECLLLLIRQFSLWALIVSSFKTMACVAFTPL